MNVICDIIGNLLVGFQFGASLLAGSSMVMLTQVDPEHDACPACAYLLLWGFLVAGCFLGFVTFKFYEMIAEESELLLDEIERKVIRELRRSAGFLGKRDKREVLGKVI